MKPLVIIPRDPKATARRLALHVLHDTSRAFLIGVPPFA